MAMITYHDRDGSAARVTWFGKNFVDGKPVHVDDPILIEKARANSFFEVSEGNVKPTAPKSETKAS